MRQMIRFATLAFLWLGLITMAQASHKIETWKTTEEADVLYIHAPELPMVDILIGVDAGGFREDNHHGLASITASMMTKGTKTLDEEAYLEALENLGSNIRVSSGTAQSIISMRSLTDHENLTQTLAILKETIEAPRFDEAVFERIRTQAIDAQKALLDNINVVASELYFATLYPNHHFGTTSTMLKSSLEQLTLDQVKAFRQEFYSATNAKIVIIGAIDRSQAKSMADLVSQSLGKGKRLTPIRDEVTVEGPIVKRQYFNSPQTRIMMGHPSINRFSDDYFALIVGNHVLGGSGLTSQLMMDIREKQGLTYGIYSTFSPSFLQGPFTISLSTKNENVDHAISETKKLVETFINEGPDEDALERAKNNLMGSMVLDLDSNAKLASAYLSLMRYELPLDYYDTFADKIRAVTKEDIQRAFKKNVDLDHMTTIIVGGDEPKEE